MNFQRAILEVAPRNVVGVSPLREATASCHQKMPDIGRRGLMVLQDFLAYKQLLNFEKISSKIEPKKGFV